jgi:dihydrofolate synthase/folylpolyglutamate synthase
MTTSIEQFLNRLHHPALAQIDLSLDRMHRLLAMLGSPHKRLPPVIHVAGTNGKGSLLANLKAMFEAAGYKVHRYTSPHLVHFRERIVLSGEEITDEHLMRLLSHAAPILQQQPATFFEATTALAFLAFAEKKADILLLETGMGGRLDATNVVDKPLLTAITPIAFDHMEFLGTTIQKIAGEKAGIIKQGVPCVIGRQNDDALAVFEKVAAQKNAQLYRMQHEWSHHLLPPPARGRAGVGVYHSPSRNLSFTPSLVGNYQYDNAATAIACLDLLPQFKISDEQITSGLANVVWPARLQKLSLANLPGHIELWLDGGHNAQGGEMLAEWLKEAPDYEHHLICGMIKGKDAAAFLVPAQPYAATLQAIAIPAEPNTQAPDQLAQTARQLGFDATPAASLEKALQSAIARAKKPARITICGSLYLAGKVLASWEKNNANHH